MKKKNFFKKLSFVMASAMVLSVISPAAGAFAKAAPALNTKSTQYLHLADEDKDEYDFNIKNKDKKAGWTYEWSSSNEKVAVVDEVGNTTAVGAGSAKITVVITDKEGDVVDTLTGTVTVRDNIKELTITNLPEADKLAVGQENDFNRSYVTNAGKTTGTKAITRWVVAEEGATISDSGLFVAEKAGEYTITANAFQSKAKYTSWLADKEANAAYVTATTSYKVTVKASMESTQQVDLDTVKVTFDDVMDEAEVKAKLALTTKVGSTDVKVTTVKEIKLDDTKKVATVDLYVPFNEGATYTVSYPEMDNVQFVAATTKAEDVVTVNVTTDKAVTATSTKVEFQLLNANGVVINTPTLASRVKLSTDSTSAYFNDIDNEILMFKTGDVAKITAVFHSYKWNTTTGLEEGNVTGHGVITGVDAASTVVGSAKAWTIVERTATPSFAANDLKKVVAVGDSKKLAIELTTVTGTTTNSIKSTDLAEIANFKFSSSDESVMYIDDLGNIYPIKAGTATVVVKYKDVIVDAITITVSPARTATVLELSSTTLNLSNGVNVKDTATVTVKVKDSLGEEMTLTSLTVEALPGSQTSPIATADLAAGTITITGLVTDALGNKVPANDGVYNLKVKANNVERHLVVNMAKAPQVAPVYYTLDVPTTVDLKVDATNNTKSINVNLFGMVGGVKVTKETIVSGGAIRIEVTGPDFKEDVLNSVDLVTAVSGGAITKEKTGNYLVTAYQKNAAGVDVAIARTQIQVTDSQVAPSLSKVKERKVTSAILLDAINEAFDFSLNGNDVAATGYNLANIIGNVDATTGVITGKVFVGKVIVREYVGSSFIDHVVDVNQYVEK